MKAKQLWQVVSFDDSDGNFTGNPSVMAGNLYPRRHAVDMLKVYRAIPHEAPLKFRYILCKQKGGR